MKLRSGVETAAASRIKKRQISDSSSTRKLRSRPTKTALVSSRIEEKQIPNPSTRKLRSTHVKKVPVSRTAEKITKLPKELKDQIFSYVLGGRCIHVEDGKTGNTQRPFRLYLCRIGKTSSSKKRTFHNETVDGTEEKSKASDPSCKDPHDECYQHMKPHYLKPYSSFGCMQTARGGPKQPLPRPLKIRIDPLLTCRQIYHDTNHILYSANTFCFQDSEVLTKFISHLDSLPSGSKTLAVRHIHLRIRIRAGIDEPYWNFALKAVASKLLNLNSVDISIRQGLWNHYFDEFDEKRFNPSYFNENTFLVALSRLKNLQSLKDMTIAVYQESDDWGSASIEELASKLNWADPEEHKFLWSIAQQRQWARDLRADILGWRSHSETD